MLYDMIHPNASATQTVRSLFVIDPAKKIRLIITYPASTGRNFDEILRVIDSLQLTEYNSVATPGNWKHGDDVVIVPSLQDPEVLKQKFPKGWNAAAALPAHDAAAGAQAAEVIVAPAKAGAQGRLNVAGSPPPTQPLEGRPCAGMTIARVSGGACRAASAARGRRCGARAASRPPVRSRSVSGARRLRVDGPAARRCAASSPGRAIPRPA